MADKHSRNIQIKCPTAALSGKTKKKELNKVSVKELKRQHVEISPSQTPDEYEPSCKQLHSKDSRGKSVELSDSFSNSSKQDLTSNLELQSSVGNTQNIHMENVTIINSKVAIQKIGSTTTSEGCSTSNEITSIGNLRENLETEAKEIVPLGLKFDESNFPCVHPNLSKTDFYKGGSTKMSEDYMPSSRQSYTPSKAEKITFEQLYRNVTPKSYTGLVGAAGSGKTTFAKRLSKTTNLTWIILLCMDLDYGSDKLTLKQLLIDYAYPELNEKKANDLFSLMLKNPEQFGIIFDGYDQATWSLDKIRPKNASYTTPLLVEELVANLCNRKFLPDIAIVLTSRPHSIVTINEILRPKEVVLVHEFTYENMKTVFFAFADKEANRIWNKFDREAPMLLELCLTPIMLQLIILAALGSDDVTELRNVTQVFTILLESLRHTEYAKGHDINVIKHKLSKIAYNATKKATVVMTFLEMDEEGLSDIKVQDIIIAVPGYQRFNQKLFDGDKKFYFTHQLFQEYFSAIHISQNMDLDEFRQNVKQIVSNPHWGMVRRFLCGLLLDNNFIVPESVDNSQQSTNKSVLFYSQLLSHYQESPDLELIVDLWECTSEVLQAFAEHFPDEAAFDGKTFRTSDAHALEMMLQHVKTVKQISLMNCGLTNESFKHICNAIGSLPNKLSKLDLTNNELGDNGANALAKVIHNVEALDVLGCGISNITQLTLAMAKESCQLKEINLSHNKICNNGLNDLAKIVHKLDNVSMEGCGTTDVSPLTKSKKFNLNRLNISNNKIGNVGMEILSEIIFNVEALHARTCDMTEIGQLTKAIGKRQTKLKKLAIGRNKIGNKGIQNLSKVIHKIEELAVGGCDITDVSQLTKNIEKKQCRIKNLELESNQIGDKGAHCLASVLQYIDVLKISQCGLTEEGKKMIKSKLAELKIPANKVDLGR